MIRNRIFIVGCPRSGTTLLQGLIPSHKEITSFVETHFFNIGIKNPLNSGFYYVSKNASDLLPRFLQATEISVKLKGKILDRIPTLPILPGFGVKNWAIYFCSVLDDIALERKKQIWVEKTPDHLKRIELIKKYLPQIKFIHIIRDGGDTIASLFKGTQQWGKKLNIDECIQYWNTAIRKSYERVNNSSDIFIYYRKLAENPTDEISKIFKLLDLTAQKNIIDRYNATISLVIQKNEYWKGKNLQKIEFQSAFEKTFNKNERDYIQQNLEIRLFDKLMEKIV